MDTGFKFSRIKIIESLPAGEPQTGQHLADYLQALHVPVAIPVEIQRCGSRSEIFDHLNKLVSQAVEGQIPLVHFECHGTATGSGLVAANGDVIEWPAISSILRELNASTGFNLVVFVAACNGGYFLEEIQTGAEAPCFGLIAPSDELDPGEVMNGTRDFYRILLSTLDVVPAIRRLAAAELSQGYWFAQLAEMWFRTVVINYVKVHCTRVEIEKRARSMYRRARAEGKAGGVGHFKRKLAKTTGQDLLGKRFALFFQIDQVPANAERFEPLRKRMEAEIRELLSRPEYKI